MGQKDAKEDHEDSHLSESKKPRGLGHSENSERTRHEGDQSREEFFDAEARLFQGDSVWERHRIHSNGHLRPADMQSGRPFCRPRA